MPKVNLRHRYDCCKTMELESDVIKIGKNYICVKFQEIPSFQVDRQNEIINNRDEIFF